MDLNGFLPKTAQQIRISLLIINSIMTTAGENEYFLRYFCLVIQIVKGMFM